MTDIDQITTHKVDANQRLLGQYRQTDLVERTIPAFATPFLDQVQELEDVLFSLIDGRSVAQATGATLSLIGELVGRPRPTSGAASTDDDIYRAQIFGQISANTSNGTICDVHNILVAIGAESVIIQDIYPAAINVNYSGTTIALTNDQIIELLKIATAPIEISASSFTSMPFGFEGDPSAFGYNVGEIGGS